MIAAERRKKIAEILMTNGSIKTVEISKLFGVSTETIRKDLIYLNKIGVAEKKHGGAITPLEYVTRAVEQRSTENTDVKNSIAKKALEFVPEHGVIFVDGGSTPLHLAKLLNLKSGYTIFTNSLGVANILANSNNTIHVTGGELNSVTKMFKGFGAINFLSKIKISVSFLGSSGFKQHNGPAVVEFEDAEVKKVVIENTSTNIVLVDSTKTKSSALVQYANWQDIDYLITDENFPDSFSTKLSKLSDLTTIIKVPILEYPFEQN